MKSSSQIRQNFSSEASTNLLAILYLQASYSYLSLGFYFPGTMSPCPGCRVFSRKLSKDKLESAECLMRLQNQRGGPVLLQAVQKPAQDEWGRSLDALQAALNLEKGLNQALLKQHALGLSQGGAHLCDFLESLSLGEEVKLLKCLGDQLLTLRHVRADPLSGLGERLSLKQD